MSKHPRSNCDACPLKTQPYVPDELRADALYTIIGEGPGWNEVKARSPFVGPSGSFLWQTLRQFGILREQCNVMNVTACLPIAGSKDEDVKAAAICCKGRTTEQLNDLPTLVLGRVARDIIFPIEREGTSATTLNGRWIGNLLSTWHPAYILRDPNEAKTFFDHVRKFAKGPTKPVPAPKIVYVQDLETLRPLLAAKRIAFDIETTQVSIVDDAVLMLQLAMDGETAYIVPGAHPGAPSDVLYETRFDPFWTALWSNKNCVFVGHNAKFDSRFLRWKFNWPVRCDFDTMLAHYCIDERGGEAEEGEERKTRSYHDLKGLCAQYLDEPDWEVTLHQYLRTRSDQYDKIPWKVLAEYAAYDATRTFSLSNVLETQLRAQNLYDRPFKSLLMPMQDMYMHAELHGVHVDMGKAADMIREYKAELVQMEQQFLEMSDGVVKNPRSSAQLATYFYDVLKLPAPKGRGVKPRTTDKHAIEQLAELHPAVKLLRAQRRMQKMVSAYLENLPEVTDANDDAHFDTKVIGTEVGRLAIKKPALHTLPRADDREAGQFGLRVRGLYTSHPGYKWGVRDYRQAELRAGGDISGEPYILWVFRSGRDIHDEVVVGVYGEEARGSKEKRNLAKCVNFSYLYGGNEHSFATTAGIPVDLAAVFIRDYQKLMPRLASFRQEVFQDMRRKGYVEGRTGRRRRFPFINEVNQDEARKAALHTQIAGPVSDCTNMAAMRLLSWFRERDVYFLFTVHDSMIFEYPDGDPELEATVFDKVGETMCIVAAEIFPSVPWETDAEAGYNWGGATKIIKCAQCGLYHKKGEKPHD